MESINNLEGGFFIAVDEDGIATTKEMDITVILRDEVYQASIIGSDGIEKKVGSDIDLHKAVNNTIGKTMMQRTDKDGNVYYDKFTIVKAPLWFFPSGRSQ